LSRKYNCINFYSSAPQTGSQTINSDDKLKNRNHETFLNNQVYYEYKETVILKTQSLGRYQEEGIKNGYDRSAASFW
jgi:hypothetical protein